MDTTTQLILFILLCFTCGHGTSSIWKCKDVPQQEVSRGSSKDWDILVLAQFWPPAACLLLDDADCNITGLRFWAIHGLWPTESGTEGPNFCNDSSAFDPSEVEALQPRLQLYWPTVEQGEDPAVLWSHEWCKHGTCGTSLPALRDELHFFNTTLGLRDRFNLTEFLASGNITPSEETAYRYDVIMQTLQEQTGSTPSITCARDKSNDRCYLEQVELCLTKSFELTDCSSKHNLLFQSERAVISGKQTSNTCSCESEDLYYKPLPSV